MLSQIRKIVKNVLRRIVFGAASSPELYVESLRKTGIKIGYGTTFFDPINTIVDIQNPKLITIGDNVRITSGCKILTHDFSSSVLGGAYGQCVGALGTVDIGNNVFIGMNTIILRNTKIGNNVIIGAGSVVSGEIESNSVYVGNPAIKKMSLEEFYEKRVGKVEKEIEIVASRIDLENPQEVWKYLREYCCDFDDSPIELRERQMHDTGYYDKCKSFYSDYTRKFRLENFK